MIKYNFCFILEGRSKIEASLFFPKGKTWTEISNDISEQLIRMTFFAVHEEKVTTFRTANVISFSFQKATS